MFQRVFTWTVQQRATSILMIRQSLFHLASLNLKGLLS
jgi:hypothetical protein